MWWFLYQEVNSLRAGPKPHAAVSCVLCSCSVMSDLCDPLDNSPPGSSVLGFFRQEYWSGLPFPPPRNLPWLSDWTLVSGVSCTVSRFFTTEPLGKPSVLYLFFFFFCLHHVECGIRPGIKPIPYAVEVLSHIHWTAREVPYSVFLMPSSSLGLKMYRLNK